jgi:hypothetical protein
VTNQGTRKSGKIRVFALLLMFIVIPLIQATQVNAAYFFVQTDDTGYSDGRVVGSPPICFYDYSTDNGTGYMQVKGDHNIPFGLEECKIEIIMRFRPTESGSFRVGATWTVSYLLETNFPVGSAVLYIKYVLYSDSYNGLESKTRNTWSISTPLWGGYHSTSGIYTRSAEDYIQFQYSLQSGTWYRMAVEIHLTLDGEANAWSQAGYPNALSVDVAEIAVWK